MQLGRDRTVVGGYSYRKENYKFERKALTERKLKILEKSMQLDYAIKKSAN